MYIFYKRKLNITYVKKGFRNVNINRINENNYIDLVPVYFLYINNNNNNSNNFKRIIKYSKTQKLIIYNNACSRT